MSIELRPLGVACNLSCHYCYQNPQRDAGNQRMSYDLDRMKAEAARIGGPFTLFGGEPLLMRFEDLEDLFAWGLDTFGSSSIQTNGVLIEDRHIDLFRRYRVSVGISIDGPGALNDARWHRGLDKTRQSTALVEAVIGRLCREYQAPGLIVTLHRGNATADRLPILLEWMRSLDALGIKGVRLHLLEVDHGSVRDSLALSPRENIEALVALARLQGSLVNLRFDLFREMEQLLSGKDGNASCTWRACDAYTTAAVQGVEGNGQSSNCGRTNKDGIDFIKADTVGYERYLALYRTPQTDNGCSGCRFFLMCKGQCPGTAVDGDWRNRTENCEEWKHLFAMIERRMILSGAVPLTIQPLRFELEERLVGYWERGRNPSLGWLAGAIQKESAGQRLDASHATADVAPASPLPLRPEPRPRVSWVGQTARELWQTRLARIQVMLEEMTVFAALAGGDLCTVRETSGASFHRLMGLAARQGLAAAVLPDRRLPGGVCTRPGEGRTGIFLTGKPAAVAAARAAHEAGDHAGFRALLNLPECCVRHGAALPAGATIGMAMRSLIPDPLETVPLPQTTPIHPLLASLGISVLPVLPCRLDCPTALEAADRYLELAAVRGYATEVGWLRECFAWAIAWSELHGITEIKTPLFKLCFQTESAASPEPVRGRRRILRAGTSVVEGGASGLRFPYAQPRRPARERTVGGLL